MKLKVGDTIKVEGRYVRAVSYPTKFWRFDVRPAKEVLYLGKRTLNNGKVFYSDMSVTYEPGEYFTAILVLAGDGYSLPILFPAAGGR